VNPILKSAWLGIHTTLAVLGDAAFAFSFIVSAMYLVQERQLKHKHLGAIFHRLPPLDVMDTIGYRALSIGWPLFTLGMITGSLWANSAWGTYWSWDPKETWSLITWFVYSVYLHARYVRGWKGTQMAVISLIGFLSVIFTYLGVNLVLSGLHSYGGLD
jgi:cytochrome c-type biogenesis protein CcsB